VKKIFVFLFLGSVSVTCYAASEAATEKKQESVETTADGPLSFVGRFFQGEELSIAGLNERRKQSEREILDLQRDVERLTKQLEEARYETSRKGELENQLSVAKGRLIELEKFKAPERQINQQKSYVDFLSQQLARVTALANAVSNVEKELEQKTNSLTQKKRSI